MPTIFDNIETPLLNELMATIGESHKADFCVGYFNLRGFAPFQNIIENWPPEQVRLLIGMYQSPSEELRAHLNNDEIDNPTAKRLLGQMVAEFHQQLTYGTPTNQDEANLRKLVRLLREKKVSIKLHLAHPLHAKLYLLHRQDRLTPLVGYLGSSNLTVSGLRYQGELNVDVLEQDAAQKLSNWFEERWNHRLSRDISEDLAKVIEDSWARPETLSPYHIYLKIAYHLSQEARMGLTEFTIPKDLRSTLLDFQGAAVRIAANHLYKRGGVIIGDVVGLGKSLMAVALARILQDDTASDTLIICPPKLKKMWQDYADKYRLIARIMSIGEVDQLAELRRYRLVLIDESHNLRNPEGKRYQAIRDYIEANECKVILLTATPYNKEFKDISAQLRLFLDPDAHLSVRPESLIKDAGGQSALAQENIHPYTIGAFEKSTSPDDWRELLRLFMVRRTRSFIITNYAKHDERGPYITFSSGEKSYFPKRSAKTIKVHPIPNDPYDRLYNREIVDVINQLQLPRYGLIEYVNPEKEPFATDAEKALLRNLGKAGKRLIGFTRTNLFKRLESSGHAFLLSIKRHLLRNLVFEYAIANNLPIPIGSYNVEALSPSESDNESDSELLGEDTLTDHTGDTGDSDNSDPTDLSDSPATLSLNQQTAKNIYQSMAANPRKYRWIRSEMFTAALAPSLASDRRKLEGLLAKVGEWKSDHDSKLLALANLLKQNSAVSGHKAKKVLVFSAYADTVTYLEKALRGMGFTRLAAATSGSADPTTLAWRFSPVSNKQTIRSEDELDILLATDVLSEGQNLQDAYQVVNYDLPWAIIRLIQRAGRVDRIGQQAEEIFCYSFLPAQGVESIISLRKRLTERLNENREVVGHDESLFEDEEVTIIEDLYSEKAGVLDREENEEVDLSSLAYQIWAKAEKEHPQIAEQVKQLQPVVYSAKASEQKGAIVYLKTSEDNDTLAYVDPSGKIESTSQLRILKMAECSPNTPSTPRSEDHHQIVATTLQHLANQSTHGQWGRPTSPRYKAITRMKGYVQSLGELFKKEDLEKALDLMNRYPLTESAKASIARQIKIGIKDADLATLLVDLMEDQRLCVIKQDHREASIICSLSLV